LEILFTGGLLQAFCLRFALTGIPRGEKIKDMEFCPPLIALVLLALSAPLASAEGDLSCLPRSPLDKPAIEYKYFPSRLHAFVFRNWTSVPRERLAAVVGATPEQIDGIAADMSLPPQGKISPMWNSANGYITVLRRNWHLLGYPQILRLLEIDAQTLASRLRDDDFLYDKLGKQKPVCGELRYAPPTPEVKEKAAHAAKVLREHGIGELWSEAEKFSFIEDFAKPKGLKPANGGGGIKIAFSYMADYGDPLMTDRSYPDGLLEALAAKGVNGVWLHVVLNTLVEPSGIFPGSKDAPKRIENLNRLIERAGKYGIKVWLYLNEPRGLGLDFFESLPERMALRGSVYEDIHMATTCTSKPEVLKWLSDSVERVFSQAPNIGGAFAITASENPTSCLAKRNRKPENTCPVCMKRGAGEVISEVNNTIFRAIKRANPNAQMISWDWGMYEGFEEILRRLDKGIIFMSVSEIGTRINRGGVVSGVGEYCLSVSEPSARTLARFGLAEKLRHKNMAKVQAGLSWEFAAAPALPVLYNCAEHAKKLRENGVDSYLLSWSLGGYPSDNLEIFSLYDESKSLDENLLLLARRNYGEAASSAVCRAWREFSTSFREYPFNIGSVYFSCHNIGAANPVYAEKSGYAATMVGIPYDDLKKWSSIYGAEIYISQMKKVADGFARGVEILKSIDTSKMDAARRENFARLCDWSETARIHFASTVNQCRYIFLRDEGKSENSAEMLELLDEEEALAARQLEILSRDGFVGYESSNHYFYTAIDLFEKFLSIDRARGVLRGR